LLGGSTARRFASRVRYCRERFVVEQIIEPVGSVPERALIEIQGAEDQYSEIRIENALSDGDGQKVKLKLREKVKVTIETTTEKMFAFHATASR
jgi:hypothetical protein